ncbi:MAG: hypothetical protein GQ574_16860 [Crocinitomix sp.]|nr:hypothetical protein [Crocinitomix sp.]
MTRKIRLIWDFYGERAEGTALHHVIHLKEFMEREKLDFFNEGTDYKADQHSFAYMTVQEKDVKIIRDALRPNRAFVEKEN